MRTKFESALASLALVVVAAASAGDGEWRCYEGYHGSVRGRFVPCPHILSATLNGPRQRKKGSGVSRRGDQVREHVQVERLRWVLLLTMGWRVRVLVPPLLIHHSDDFTCPRSLTMPMRILFTMTQRTWTPGENPRIKYPSAIPSCPCYTPSQPRLAARMYHGIVSGKQDQPCSHHKGRSLCPLPLAASPVFHLVQASCYMN